jgi:hypothetical protein
MHQKWRAQNLHSGKGVLMDSERESTGSPPVESEAHCRGLVPRGVKL